MSSYKELVEQRRALDAQIQELLRVERRSAIEKVKLLIVDFGLTEKDIFGGPSMRSSKLAGSKVAAKYRDPATGQTWTGRGKAPAWIADKDRDQFLIV